MNLTKEEHQILDGCFRAGPGALVVSDRHVMGLREAPTLPRFWPVICAVFEKGFVTVEDVAAAGADFLRLKLTELGREAYASYRLQAEPPGVFEARRTVALLCKELKAGRVPVSYVRDRLRELAVEADAKDDCDVWMVYRDAAQRLGLA